MSLLDWQHRRTDRWADERLVDALVWSFRAACIGAGVAQAVDAPIAGTSHRAPEISHVELGPPVRLTVRMPPGMIPAALARAGRLIAPHLGGIALRVTDRGHGWAHVTVLTSDPLAGALELPAAAGAVLLGRDESGDDVALAHPAELPHLIVQGQTRSGKSTWLYALLAQLARRPDVVIGGIDPSGITLRPFAASRHAHRQALGLGDLAHVEAVLAELVAEMDRRMQLIPMTADTLATSDDAPVIVVVLEEYPALLRALDVGDPKQGKRVRALTARLLAESHKVGVRVILAAQRAEATIVGGAERAQCAGRLSFRVDSAETVKLLHTDAEDYIAGHTSAEPGIALLTWPGRPLTRIRGPHLTYSSYSTHITTS